MAEKNSQKIKKIFKKGIDKSKFGGIIGVRNKRAEVGNKPERGRSAERKGGFFCKRNGSETPEQILEDFIP